MTQTQFRIAFAGTIIAILTVIGVGVDWPNVFTSTDTIPEQATFSPAEIEKIIEDWPVVMAEVDSALKEYRDIGGSRSGENAIRRGVQANTFARLGWSDGRAEYLVSYLYMLRNSLFKNTGQHRALGYFMEHYLRNQAVSEELKEWQIDQIELLLNQINEAPNVNEFPPGDVELMARYFDQFHAMLVNYGRQPTFAQR